MQNPPPNRRYLLKALAGMGVLAPLPLWAAPLPTVEEVAFDPDIPALGNPDGNVTVVEYTDYQCPYCKLSYIELSKVMAEDGNIRLVLRDWPIFGQVSRNAALLTLASHSQGRYAEAVKTLMTANERLTFRSTANLLSDAGIDVELARNELGARQDILVSLLTRTEAQAKAFQLKGTPGFLIGKSLYKRGMTADDFRKAIAQARA
ncbi:DsbA family protein [Aminobacter sp. P9b]|uniref:DsbA family protein n=1 Tax=Aminobacter sp. P9b TaxID=3133697 RepID=UPI003246D94F